MSYSSFLVYHCWPLKYEVYGSCEPNTCLSASLRPSSSPKLSRFDPKTDPYPPRITPAPRKVSKPTPRLYLAAGGHCCCLHCGGTGVPGVQENGKQCRWPARSEPHHHHRCRPAVATKRCAHVPATHPCCVIEACAGGHDELAPAAAAAWHRRRGHPLQVEVQCQGRRTWPGPWKRGKRHG